jgi:hypothetical protein
VHLWPRVAQQRPIGLFRPTARPGNQLLDGVLGHPERGGDALHRQGTGFCVRTTRNPATPGRPMDTGLAPPWIAALEPGKLAGRTAFETLALLAPRGMRLFNALPHPRIRSGAGSEEGRGSCARPRASRRPAGPSRRTGRALTMRGPSRRVVPTASATLSVSPWRFCLQLSGSPL